jgi:oxygen-independent coproporphyrinogen-3 oxidase
VSNVTLPIAGEQREPDPASEPPTPATAHPGRPVRSLYVHIPFCFHKCHYCDFYSLVDTRDRMAPFVDRLIADLRSVAPWSAGAPLRTIFVGGGTPTLLPAELWERLLAGLHDAFDLSRLGASGAGEFTVECNPETANAGLFAVLASAGVNRISIGAQSFDPRHLRTLERWHDPENVSRAVELARDAGIERQSLDLIYAIPGQSLDDALRDVDRALDLGVTHVSAYSLTYEPGTAMTARLQRGEFDPTPDETDAEMMTAITDRLRAAGLRRYETSNFAAPGHECRHNLAYWRGEDWIPVGPSASGHIAGHRWKNAPRLGTYLASPGCVPAVDHERPDARRALAERAMTGLRLAEGLDAEAYLAGCRALEPGLPSRVRAWVRSQRTIGRLLPNSARRPERWVLSDAGMLAADGIAAQLMSIVDP